MSPKRPTAGRRVAPTNALAAPPAETLARVQPATRLGLAPGGDVLHVLAGTVTRCGARTVVGWQAYGGDTGAHAGAPCVLLCRRCVAGLPLELRRKLEPSTRELARVYERQARTAAGDLVRKLKDLRTAALTDGAAYERTRLVRAQLAPYPTVPRGARPLTRAQRGALVTGHVATEEELTLVELLNRLDPTRPDVAGQRVWVGLEAPAPGTAVDVGGTHDARLWQGRRR